MRILASDRGAALVTALMLTMLALVISLTLLYVVESETRISASQRRYRTALAAAHGGVELFTQEIMPQLFQGDLSQAELEGRLRLVGLTIGDYGCLQQKLKSASAEWSACCRARATADASEAPDAIFRLSSDRPGEKSFEISTKIIDTVPGNSDKAVGNDLLDVGGGVTARDELIHPRHVPGLYSIAVQGVREGGETREKAQLSVLYAY